MKHAEKLKVKNPLRDITFYAALFPIFLAVAPPAIRDWVAANKEAAYPLLAWLVMNGWLRKTSIQHAGEILKAGR